MLMMVQALMWVRRLTSRLPTFSQRLQLSLKLNQECRLRNSLHWIASTLHKDHRVRLDNGLDIAKVDEDAPWADQDGGQLILERAVQFAKVSSQKAMAGADGGLGSGHGPCNQPAMQVERRAYEREIILGL